MIFDGIRWTRCRTVVPLPRSMWSRNGCYVEFGKIVPSNTKGAIKTEYKWNGIIPRKFWGQVCQPLPDGREDGRDHWFVYALPIKSKGHSLSNFAYAENGNMYLLYKGVVYVRGRQKSLA